jgi:hypothetical protein
MTKYTVDVELADGTKPLRGAPIKFAGKPLDLIRIVQACFSDWRFVQAWDDSGATAITRGKDRRSEGAEVPKKRKSKKRKKKTAYAITQEKLDDAVKLQGGGVLPPLPTLGGKS